MSRKTRKSLSLSAAVAAVLFASAGDPVAWAANADGVTLQISGTANTSGLFGQVYSLQQPSVAGAEPALSATVGASTNLTANGFPILESALNQATVNASGYSNVNFNNTNFGTAAPFSAYGSTLTDNITARWSGYISLPTGVTTFATNSDDGSVLYIDGVRVVNNNLFQGNTRRIGQTVNFATAGVHEIVIAYYEGTGGAGVEVRYAPGLATTNVNDPAFTIIPVVDGSSNQILTGVQNTVLTPADGVVTFATGGTTGGVDYTNALQVNMGALTFAGGNTLNYEGAAARFASTTFNGGGTNVLTVSTGSTFSQDIALGQLNDGGVAVRLQKTGPGQLVLDQTTNPNAMSSGSVVEIRGGGLVLSGTNGGQNPLGAASIELGSTLPSPPPGGVTVTPSTLSLTSKTGNVTFDNAVNVTSSNTIIAQQLVVPGNATMLQGSSVGVPTAPTSVANATVTLGSATNGVTVAAGQTVTFQTNNGYTLNLAGGVSGAGNVSFAPGIISLGSQLTNTGTFTISAAGATTLNYNTDIAFNNRAFAVTGASQLNIGAGITSVGGDTFNIGAGNVFSLPNATVGALFTRGGNLTASTGAVIAETGVGGANGVQGLGTNSDLLFGFAANLADDVTVGSIPGSTPWRGISTDRTARTMSGGTITALSNFQFSNVNNVNLDIGAITIAALNGPVVASINMGTGRVRTVAATVPTVDSNVTFTINGGAFQLVGAQSLGSNGNANVNARIVAYPGTTVDPNGVANAMSGNISLLHASFLQLNDANNLGGIGVISGESGAVVQIQNATALGNANAAQNLATLPAGVVYRLEQDLGASLAANTNPAGNFQVHGNNRTNTVTLSAGTPTRAGYLSGLLTNDGASRTLNAAGAVTIGAGGATFASTNTFTFTIAAPVTVSPGGGRSLTVGTTRIVDPAANGDIRGGTVVLSSATNNWGTGADALARLDLVGRANLQNLATAGVSALPQGPALAVSLGGIYQINGGSGGGTSTIQLGQLTPRGGDIILNRNATTPDALVVNLNAPIARSNTFGPGARGSVIFQTVTGQTLGTSDKVVFANAADAPARISGTSGTINMVAPWMVGTDGTGTTAATTFLDVDPATATTTGFVPVAYVAMPLSGGTGDEIADNTAATTLTGPITVAALRTNSAISGQTINLTTGGLIMRGAAAAFTISSAFDFGANEGIITNVSGQANNISGALSGTGGLTKLGGNSLALINASSTLTGGITIAEFNLRPGVINGIPVNNVVTINPAGILDLNNFDQSVFGIRGSGVVTNNIGGTRTLTLTAPNAGETFEFTGTIRNATGTVALTKTGPGTQILSGTLGYTGATNVMDGTLLVEGISSQASAYTVGAGATLGGSGIITGAISVSASGTLAPGGATPATAIGSMRTGNLTFSAGANFSLGLNSAAVGTGLGAGTGYDQADVVGTVSLNGANLQLALNYAPSFGDKLFILNNDQIDAIVGTFGSLNGTPTTLSEGSLVNLMSSFDNQSYQFQISYRGEFYGGNLNVGNDIVLVAVPEPSGVALLATAVVGFMVRRRKRA
jgi:autotransporter-associated beta strand protein